MKTHLLLLAVFAATTLSAQNQPVLGEEAVKVSDNVCAIMGFPNIAIIVGNRATLVVDTGLGPGQPRDHSARCGQACPCQPKTLSYNDTFPSRARRRAIWFSPAYDPDPQFCTAAGNGTARQRNGGHGPTNGSRNGL